jgi:precorrin-6y C5,15-methyltransferase (decarboxylating) CbiE subunit/precorrin-6Y C5,15-methyltransferase (decarboxylating) CbiT subunit
VAKLCIVGTGPGSADYVTAAARKVVQDADVIIGAERSLSLFQKEIKGETLVLNAKNMEEAIKYAVNSVQNGKAVALLSTGDPGFSGLLGSYLRRSIDKKVEVAVIPGISSVQACAARLCMNWDDAVLFAFHNGIDVEKKRALTEAIKNGKSVFLLPEPKGFPPNEIANYLLSLGIDGEISVSICENLTLNNECVLETTLFKAAKLSFSPLCVMVIKGNPEKKYEMVNVWNYKTTGIPDEMFTQNENVPGPTKEEIRVITISKARLREGSVVVDVGCGTGGLTVEAALQVTSKGRVYSIDEDEEAVKLTKVNIAKFGLQDIVQVTKGVAPEALANLPDVDAFLIGGSHSLRQVIRIAQKKLNANGRIVVNAILLETATTALDEIKKIGFKDVDVVEIFAAKGKTAGAGTMMLARNPITIVSATKE